MNVDGLQTKQTSSQAKQKRFSLSSMLLTATVFAVVGAMFTLYLQRIRRHAPQIVVSVNGHNIERAAFMQRVEMAAGPSTLHEMINEELHIQFAQKSNVLPTEADVEARFASDSRQPDFQQQLDKSHLSPALYRHRILAELSTEAVLTLGVQVTDAQIRSYYQSQIASNNPTARYYIPATIQIRLIILKNEADARNAIQDLNSGTPFETVASQRSADNSRANGGLIPPFQQGRTKVTSVPGLEAAIFALKVGQQLGPRQFGKAWWIVRCVDKSEARVVPFEQVKDECRTRALVAEATRVKGGIVAAEFNDFVHHSLIQAFDPNYAKFAANK